MRHLLLLTLIFNLIIGYAQQSKLPITNIGTDEYGKKQSIQNWDVAQDSRGLIYVGNQHSVLEYDGQEWRPILVSKNNYVKAVSSDSSGVIFIGTGGEFGYLVPDENGKLKYVKLSENLVFDDFVERISATSENVFFQTESKLYVYDYKEITTIAPATSFHLSASANNRFFIRQREVGLMEYVDGKLELINEGEKFKDIGVFSVMPYGTTQNQFLIATYEDGLWVYSSDKEESIKLISTDFFSPIYSSAIYGGIKTGPHQYALNTLQNGILIVNDSANVIESINQATGLAVNDVKAINFDRSGNLWCALENGIAKVDYYSPFSIYKENSGIRGTVNKIIEFKDALFVGTSEGLFKQKKNSDFNTEANFLIINKGFQVWDLIVIEDELLVGTSEGVFQFEAEKLILISSDNSRTLAFQDSLKLLTSAGKNGITFLLRKGTNWEKIIQIDKTFGLLIKSAFSNNFTNTGVDLWLGTVKNGIVKLQISKDLTYSIETFNSSNGLPNGATFPFSYNEKVLFATQEGIMRFNKNGVDELSEKKDTKNSNEIYFDTAFLDEFFTSSAVLEAQQVSDKLWLSLENKINFLNVTANTLDSVPFKTINMNRINDFFQTKKGVDWIISDEGLIRYIENENKKFETPYACLIRQIDINKDSVIFNGTFAQKSDRATPTLLLNQPKASKANFDFENNTIAFNYSALFYEQEEKMVYSHFLEGYDDEWSNWSKVNTAKFKNLAEGEYHFKVKAKNIYGLESEEAFYVFSISPPWYRSKAAYLAYFILGIFLIYLIVKLSVYSIKKKNIKLESIIKIRTKEVEEQKDELEKTHHKLAEQHKEVADSIKYAQRLQQAILPSIKEINREIENGFVLFQPKDVVSGDFYWMEKSGDNLYFASADCTGHGVPGAMVSVVCSNALDRALKEYNLTDTGEILDKVTDLVIKRFEKSGEEVKDGMDIALCCINWKTNKLQYSGANNPLWVIRKRTGEEIFSNLDLYNDTHYFIEYRATKQPVGKYADRKPFEANSIDLLKGDSLYLFTDGFADQFGGPNDKKYKYKPFKRLLLKINNASMVEQKTLLLTEFNDWKGEAEQLDDVCIIGVKV
jgi:serine phosphatase RsbU (regulator of sigma subunit)/ligand-binding sensor domain-containing protein